MATSPECSGEGSTYRVIARLWRQYFHPPTDTNDNSWYWPGRQTSKLIAEGEPKASRRARSLRIMG